MHYENMALGSLQALQKQHGSHRPLHNAVSNAEIPYRNVYSGRDHQLDQQVSMLSRAKSKD